jgi:hypothetical protein
MTYQFPLSCGNSTLPQPGRYCSAAGRTRMSDAGHRKDRKSVSRKIQLNRFVKSLNKCLIVLMRRIGNSQFVRFAAAAWSMARNKFVGAGKEKSYCNTVHTNKRSEFLRKIAKILSSVCDNQSDTTIMQQA